jgi:hypothetical protein
MHNTRTYMYTYIHAGANPYIRDEAGETPLDVAENIQNDHICSSSSAILTSSSSSSGSGQITGQISNSTLMNVCEMFLRHAMGMPVAGEDVFISHILIKHKVCVHAYVCVCVYLCVCVY